MGKTQNDIIHIFASDFRHDLAWSKSIEYNRSKAQRYARPSDWGAAKEARKDPSIGGREACAFVSCPGGPRRRKGRKRLVVVEQSIRGSVERARESQNGRKQDRLTDDRRAIGKGVENRSRRGTKRKKERQDWVGGEAE